MTFCVCWKGCDDFFILKDWSYSMRQDKQMIVKGIFLGPYAAASKTQVCLCWFK